jgi:hypothetical protein
MLIRPLRPTDPNGLTPCGLRRKNAPTLPDLAGVTMGFLEPDSLQEIAYLRVVLNIMRVCVWGPAVGQDVVVRVGPA